MGKGRQNGEQGGGGSPPRRDEGQDVTESCPAEMDLEQLVLGRLSARKRKQLDRHIETCFACNELYRAFSYFYRQAKNERVSEGAYPGTAAPIPHPLSDYVIHMEPVHEPEILSENGDDAGDSAFAKLCFCASLSGKFKATVLLDRKTDNILVRLDTGDERILGHVSVHLDGIKESSITDARGIAVFGPHEPSLFMDTRIRVCLPLLRIRTNVGVDLNQEELFNPDPVPGFPVESVWVYIDEENALCLELGFGAHEGDQRRYTAACFGRGRPAIIPVFGGVGVFRNVSLGAPLLITVYPN